ncbi:MAG: ABC transporter substrate-binding protein [Wenzhouxiangellaceae bacterium]|nr:ABC transporter substrate-binding protein [Wenzhouxiangellaceae bacterium]
MTISLFIRTAFVAVATAWCVAAFAQDQPEEPVRIVRETTDKLFAMVDGNRDMYEQNVEKLEQDIRPILLPNVDTLYSGRLVLGRQARGLEREKILEFSEALSDLLIRQYADGLLEFKTRDQVEVLPLSGENTERMTRVKTRVTLENGQQAPVDYVFRKADEGWKIFDVIVEGISYVATFRNQIGEQIRQQGFDTTLAKLKRGEIDVRIEDD